MDANQELPIIAMPGTTGNDPAQLDSLQLFAQSHLAGIETFWWCLWGATLAILLVRFVIMPMLAGQSSAVITGSPEVSIEKQQGT